MSSARRRNAASPLAFFVLAVLSLVLLAPTARAEDSIIKRPGDHPNYSVELEPHLAFAFLAPTAGSNGIGLGGRATIPIVRNGFVPSINNSVGIGFGLDYLHYNGCYYWNGRGYIGGCNNLNSIYIPVVLQWNFFLSTHWSVFGEPGLAIHHRSWGNGMGCVDQAGRAYDCGGAGPNAIDIDPFIFFVGGRYHFSESASLTMRIGWPYASIGVSFFP
jgi:hypothetical protein